MPFVVKLAASCSRTLMSCSQNKFNEFSSDFKVDFTLSDKYNVHQMHLTVRCLQMLVYEVSLTHHCIMTTPKYENMHVLVICP